MSGKGNKTAAMKSAVMMTDKKKMDALRVYGKRNGLHARQQYMLSYLSRAQMAQWNKYSPIQQRKIMEEIEKKLDRKMPVDEGAMPSLDRHFAFDVDAYEDEKKEASDYRIRGHPEDVKIRMVSEADIRQGRTILRVNPARSMILRTGGRAKPDRGSEGETVPSYKVSRKPSLAGYAAKKQEKGRSDRKIHPGNRGRGEDGSPEVTLKAVRGPMLQRSAKGLLLRNEREGTTNWNQIPGEAVESSYLTRNRTDPMYDRKGSKIQRNSIARMKAAGNKRNVPQGEGSYPPFPGGTKPGSVKSSARYQAGRKTAITMLSAKENRDHNDPFFVSRKDGEVSQLPSGTTKDPDRADPDIASKKVGKWTLDGQVPLFIKQEDEAKEKERQEVTVKAGLTASEADTSDALDISGSGAPEEKRSVTLTKRQTEKEIFHSSALLLKQRDARSSTRPQMRAKQKERKREAKYQREFAALLIATIEKDMAKQANIRQAQKSGQIQATVAELTGDTGRSAMRTAAIPLRLHLAFIGKKLREELKKRMKEAARNLMRHAATFGAPIFAVVIIVMLLASICMIGTTEDQPQGTGLGFKIVQEAKKHLGLPYVYGGTSLVDGCDCSGFVWAIYNIFGYNLPRTAGDQYAYGRKVGSDVSDWQLGDLIYYSRTGSVQSGGGRAEHIVIYIGGGQVISCGPVAIYNWDYRSDYYGTCRIIPDEPHGGDFSGSTNEEICWNYFISQGFSEAAAAGILGNMYVESAGTFDPSIHQYGGGPGRGLCQWEESYSGGSGRYNNLVAFANGLGKSWDDITAQLQFVSYELDSGAMNPYFAKFGGVEAFKNSTDPTTATYVFLCGFEYCGDPGQSFLESAFSLSTRVDHAGWAYLNYQ